MKNAQKLFDRAAELQTQFWDALRDLELELDMDFDYASTEDLSLYDSVEDYVKAQEENN